MESIIIMDERRKRRMGIISYIPLAAFTICFVYYLFILAPVIATQGLRNQVGLNTQTSLHYGTMFTMLAISGIIGAFVLIYFIVHLAKVKHLSSAKKIQWILILTAFVPVTCPLFWHMEIKREARILPVYSDIA